MGIKLFGGNSSGSFDNCECNYCEPDKQADASNNPNPKNWVLIGHKQVGDYLVVEAKYPDCLNYEGRKVMVFKCELEVLKKQKAVDPHFGQGKLIYPIARFQPNREGWNDALEFAKRKCEE